MEVGHFDLTMRSRTCAATRTGPRHAHHADAVVVEFDVRPCFRNGELTTCVGDLGKSASALCRHLERLVAELRGVGFRHARRPRVAVDDDFDESSYLGTLEPGRHIYSQGVAEPK